MYWHTKDNEIEAIISPEIKWNTFMELVKSAIVLSYPPTGCPIISNNKFFHLQMIEEEYQRWINRGINPEESAGAFMLGLADRVDRERKDMKILSFI